MSMAKRAAFVAGLAAAIGVSMAAGLGRQSGGQSAVQPGAASPPAAPAGEKKDTPMANDPAYILNHTVNTIDGEPVSLETYKGKVLMIVNVASRCGFTPQYEGLEKLYKEKKDAGLVVLGFPANDFMGQEPGTNEEIKAFCSTKYNVTFPMFAKISVKGKDIHPLYAQITSLPKPVGEEPGWNFTKYLVDRSGRVVARFGPRVTPGDKDLVAEVNRLLAAE